MQIIPGCYFVTAAEEVKGKCGALAGFSLRKNSSINVLGGNNMLFWVERRALDERLYNKSLSYRDIAVDAEI